MHPHGRTVKSVGDLLCHQQDIPPLAGRGMLYGLAPLRINPSHVDHRILSRQSKKSWREARSLDGRLP